jgi:hypothetical protein
MTEQKHSLADNLLELVAEIGITLFHDSENIPYADTGAKIFKVESTQFKKYLAHTFRKRYKKALPANTLADAVTALAGQAEFDGEQVSVFLRCAKHGTAYVIDLADSTSDDAIIVTSKTWTIGPAPVKFYRPQSMRPLPRPVARGANVELLWKYINVEKDDRILVLAWTLEALRPDTPYLILQINGAEGSAKSTSQDNLRCLIDPNAVNLRTAPKNKNDILVSAKNNYLVSYENMSTLPPDAQDTLCTLATGGGQAERMLYTNAEEYFFDATRPVVFNGINPIVNRQDLLGRIIPIVCPTIAAGHYLAIDELKNGFERDAPKILGGLLNLFVASLKQIPRIKTDGSSRMVNFIQLGKAIEKVRGKKSGETFSAKYDEKIKTGRLSVLESSPVCCALLHVIDEEKQYYGTYADLLKRLAIYKRDQKYWPTSPKNLSEQLNRNKNALTVAGLDITQDAKRKSGGYYVRIKQNKNPLEKLGLVHEGFTSESRENAKLQKYRKQV